MTNFSAALNSISSDTGKIRKNILFLLSAIVYLFFFYLMLKITLQYIPYDTDVAFLRIKQDVIDVPFYKIAFFTHVYTAIFVLIAGLTQFSTTLRKTTPRIHRYSGWLYTIIVILFAGPQDFTWGFMLMVGSFHKLLSVCLPFYGFILQ